MSETTPALERHHFDTMAWLTYSAERSDGYEDWLRAVDNPFFNSRPGIAHYSNWKIVAQRGTSPPFTHFDFLGLTGPDAVERVWFDGPLDDFRAGWVKKWGYAGGVPAAENQFAYLANRSGGARGAASRFVIVVGTAAVPTPTAEFEGWTLTSLLRKHWAVGRAPAGAPWRLDLGKPLPFGIRGLLVKKHPDANQWDLDLPAGRFALCAECIAAPNRP